MKNLSKISIPLQNWVIMAVVAGLCLVSGYSFKWMHKPDYIWTGNPALSEIRMLSDYVPSLHGTPQDTPIYVFKGRRPGGSMLVLGGTHANEFAGILNAVLLVENVKVEEGTLYVIPHVNASGITHTEPFYGMMDRAVFDMPDGSRRTFRIGTRLSNPVHQWPDLNFYSGKSGRVLVKDEVPEIRNMNRNYPGNPSGTLLEKANYAVQQLIVKEGIDLLYDAHEAGPLFNYIDYLIVHERAFPIGSFAVISAQFEGVDARMERSGLNSFGLTHRALGDSTDVFATLYETMNLAQGSHTGKVTREMTLYGFDANSVKLTEWGLMTSAKITSDGFSIDRRVASHMVMVLSLAEAMTILEPDKPLILSGMPSYDEFLDRGLESLLFKPAR